MSLVSDAMEFAYWSCVTRFVLRRDYWSLPGGSLFCPFGVLLVFRFSFGKYVWSQPSSGGSWA